LRDSPQFEHSRKKLPDDNNPFAESIASAPAHELASHVRDPRFDEAQALVLLSRADLPTALLDEIGKRRELLKSTRVCYALASHPHASHAMALRGMRNLYVMDLVKLSLAPAVAGAVRTAAEDVLIARLPQLPLGQKIALARQASARVLTELLILGHLRFVNIVLESPRLTEAAVLKALSKADVGDSMVPAISSHPRWPVMPNVRIALLNRPELATNLASKLLSECSAAELRILSESTRISAGLRREIAQKLSRDR
jgi:hypothetical protein